MWAFLIGTALLVWALLVVVVWHKIRAGPSAKRAYDNIVLARR
jgi:hypothetical protein